MAERFDSLFGWLDEQEAIRVLHSNAATLPNPGLQYVAATRLGAASSPESLNALLAAAAWRGPGINERLTRRKALEALGRRPDPRSVARAVEALSSSDAGAVVSAANSLSRLRAAGQTMDPGQLTDALVGALHGPGTQQRAVIQCLTRLELHGAKAAVEGCINHPDRLLDGAARACLVRQGGPATLLQPVLSRLQDPEAGQRRTAVIDLGLAAQPEHLAAVVRTPTSMPLRALTAFSLARRALANGHAPATVAALLDELCHDDPRRLRLIGQPQPTENTPAGWIQLLLQRDENCQYAAAAGILQQPGASQAVILEHLHRHHHSDYGGHYMLMRLVGLGGHHGRSGWLKQGLAQTAPQYRKSRIAAAVAMGELALTDQQDALQALQDSQEEQLRWAAAMALALLQGQAQASLALRAQALR
ncbi:MAG: HEAT repeat domain-containing protein [Synechococcus sp. SB0668_bin_15]|nr:HEAT repeat domain-containing protein [Synechococcus sp. SB0668_bin_15]MXZ83167.1 HEAT repeat domain-containing protein [Synechococcus sp. SB0666_bin_14]MYC50408.1 HEAT repeat domain-containing protein [Synechococcus sp. SB0662_bin_14]MYG45940.1 HEAT repeat domain-containing protein [Synechococcus sp. SB0675_bin_6]MYK92044.1 HEAT repeat domain-containing protein [Synechococcus sp. SB0669_bin_8]